MASVEFLNVEKIYPGGTRAVEDLCLKIEPGELLVLVGPSGCGKTTALRLLAGLEQPTRGEMRIGGTVVNRTPPHLRDVAMVFQGHALYPHLTIRENMAFPLRLRKCSREETTRLVEETALSLGLAELLDRKPESLSGGQLQKAAMGRALVRDPQALLLDEPLSNLDARLRQRVRSEIAAARRRTKTTTLYVTHDQTEAMSLGDRLAVMKSGRLQQAGTAR
ncbi:MAG: ABC transporter ATP-binding protein, partial [Planctomycetales bacterium]